MYKSGGCPSFVCLLVMMLDVPVNKFSVISGIFPLSLSLFNQSQQCIKSLAQGHSTVTSESLELASEYDQEKPLSHTADQPTAP